MPPESHLPCYLDTLSNELLDRIFDFIPMKFAILYGKTRRSRRLMSQPLVLMHVSRRFRAALLHSERWLDFDFEFFSNIGGPLRKLETSVEYRKRYISLISLLLDDPAVVACLSRKRDWVIPCVYGSKIDLAQIIVKRIPNLHAFTRKLGVHFDAKLLLTTVWPAVVELTITIYAGLRADLTALSAAFPNLQYLQVRASSPWTGSLDSFQHLVHLDACVFVEAAPSILGLCDTLFPSQSAKSITHLALGGQSASLNAHPKFSLKSFTNLEHLELRGDTYRCLSDVSTKLISLHLDGPSDVNRQPISFAHPCLSNLHSLRLRLSNGDYEVKMWDMLESMSENLRGLHHLILEHFVFDAHRVGCLAKLVELKSLAFGWRSWVQHGIGKSEPAAMIPPVFKKHDPKPRIHIFPQGRWDSEKVNESILPKSRFPDIYWNLPDESMNVVISRSYR
jgi:hypothetical protein